MFREEWSHQHQITKIECSPPHLSCRTLGKTVSRRPLGHGCPVTIPHPIVGNHITTVHAHLQAEKLQHKTKQFSIRNVQRAANVLRPTP